MFHVKQAIVTTLKRIRLHEEIHVNNCQTGNFKERIRKGIGKNTKNIVASVGKSDVGQKI